MIDFVESTNFAGGNGSGRFEPGESCASAHHITTSTSDPRAERGQSDLSAASHAPKTPPMAGVPILSGAPPQAVSISGGTPLPPSLKAAAPVDYTEANRRLLLLKAFRAMTAPADEDHPDRVPLSPKAAAKEIGVPRVTLWRWDRRVTKHDLDDKKQLPTILDALCDRTSNSGRSGQWEPLLLIAGVCTKLRELHASTLAASCAPMTNDRRTGSMAATLKLFTLEPECPEALKPKLLAGKFPVCLTRFLGRVTPEIEARIRGPKHFQLHGFYGKRDKTIGLPDGSRAYLPAGWVIELDDMSVNQPFWVESPGTNDEGQNVILSRQGLYARCLKGGWRAVELIARPRESYTSADILRFLRRFCQLYGKPRKIRIEQAVWAARNIAGFRLQGEEWKEDNFVRPAMADDDRQNLKDGLSAIGIEVEYCYSARGKSDLEGAFHPLQRYLAGFTRDFQNIGRHAGEFELAAKQLRRVRAGSHHPRDLGFPHQSELLERIQKTFDFVNSLPPTRPRTGTVLEPAGGDACGTSFDEVWRRDTEKWPLTVMSVHDLAAFFPTLRQAKIRGGFVTVTVDGREFDFRCLDFARLGDGYKVYVKFDETEPSLGAAIYNREGLNSTNPDALKDGDFVGFADFDVPASTTYAATVPSDLPRQTVEELYGAGAENNWGDGIRAQKKWAGQWVRSAFSGRLPGQPAIKTVETRSAAGAGQVTVTKVSTHTGGGQAVPAPRNLFAPPTEEQVAKRRARLSRQAQLANQLVAGGD